MGLFGSKPRKCDDCKMVEGDERHQKAKKYRQGDFYAHPRKRDKHLCSACYNTLARTLKIGTL